MGKCLVTKLKEVVQNDDLLKIGELMIKKKSDDSVVLQLNSLGSNVKTLGSIATTKNSSKLGTEFPADGYFTMQGKGQIVISEKYNLTNLLFAEAKNKVFDFSQFDANSLKYCKNLNNLQILNDSLSLDLTSLKDLPLSTIEINSVNLTGNISEFISKETLQKLNISSPSINDNVDLSKAANSLSFFYGQYNKCTWTIDRPSEAFIISLPYQQLGDYVDAMLINQAKCKASGNSNKKISVSGNRTTASDEAITTLQGKGYTVSVSPAL